MAVNRQIKKIVLAYSGGLDTSVILRWLKDNYDCEVIAFCADVGQAEEISRPRGRRWAPARASCYVADLREEFARDFVFPMLRADAVYERPLPAGHVDRAAAHRQAPGRRSRAPRAPTRWPTARPARATTRCASS